MKMACEKHVQSLERMVTYYRNLSWYKKLFFPKTLSYILQSLHDESHRGYSIENTWMLVHHLLRCSERFRAWFDEIDVFIQTPLMQACIMMNQHRALTRQSFGHMATHLHLDQLCEFLQLFRRSKLSIQPDSAYCIQFITGYLNHHSAQDITDLLELLIQMNQEGFLRPFYCRLVLNSKIKLNEAIQFFRLVEHLGLREEAFHQLMLSWGANFRRSLLFYVQRLFSSAVDYDDLLRQVVAIKEPMQVLDHLEELVEFGLMQNLSQAQHFYHSISNCDLDFFYRDDICQALKFLHQRQSLSLQLYRYDCLKLIQAKHPSEMAELLTDAECVLCLQQSPHAETFLEIMHRSLLPKNIFYSLLNMEKNKIFDADKGYPCLAILLNAHQEPASLAEAIARLQGFDLLSYPVLWAHLQASIHPHLWAELLIMLWQSKLFNIDSLVEYSEIITQLNSFDIETALSTILSFKHNETEFDGDKLQVLKERLKFEPPSLAHIHSLSCSISSCFTRHKDW
jgi:hypothetical protein